MNVTIYTSERGMPLVYTGLPPQHRPILTVENYLKWYNLHVIDQSGKVTKVCDHPDFNAADSKIVDGAAVSVFSDHVWNPAYVEALAEALNLEVCDRSMEIIIGRWVSEIEERQWSLKRKK